MGIDLITGKIMSFLGSSAEPDAMPIRSDASESERPEAPS